MIMLHPAQLREYAKAPFDQKANIIFALSYKIAKFETESVTCATITNGSNVVMQISDETPNAMEIFSRDILAKKTSVDPACCVWPSNLFFFIQLTYVLFTGSHFSTPGLLDFANSFKSIQQTYFNRLKTAILHIGAPVGTKEICNDLDKHLTANIISVVSRMCDINDKHARVEMLSMAITNGIVFEDAMKLFRIRKQQEAERKYQMVRVANQALDQRLQTMHEPRNPETATMSFFWGVVVVLSMWLLFLLLK